MFTCYATIRKPLITSWAYQIVVHRVRFDEAYAAYTDRNLVIGLIIVGVILLILLIIGAILGIFDLFIEIFVPSAKKEGKVRKEGTSTRPRQSVGPW